jgi:septum formation protein
VANKLNCVFLKRQNTMLDNLRNYNIILASQSPRRLEMLKMACINFQTVVRPDLSEDFPSDMPVSEIPGFLALQKLSAYSDLWSKSGNIVITADTIVTLGGKVLNKPSGHDEAIDMLTLLSGKTHEVITGVAIKSSHKEVVFASTTQVSFKKLTFEEISYYVTNYKPFDKAGAYGIQEWIGLVGIGTISGSYFNVVGLPVDRVYEELSGF